MNVLEERNYNRSTLYDYLKNTDLELRFTEHNGRRYKVFRIPYKWDESYLMINDVRITNFEAIILYTNEIVIRFMMYGDCQINIPYKEIHYIEVSNDMDLGYHGLRLNKKR